MIAITIATHPSQILTANQRLHWAAKARLTSGLRTAAAIRWTGDGQPQLSRAAVVVEIGYPDRRKRDAHNLMPTVKAHIDGLTHPGPGVRGLLPDDSDDYLTGPDLRHLPELDGGGRFTFRYCIEELT